MSTGNVMGKLITPTTTAAPGIWNLREHQLAVQSGTWTGIFASDTTPGSNVLTMKAIGIPGATNNVFRDGSTNNFAVTRNGDVTQGTFSPYFPSGYWSGYFDGSGDSLTIPDSTALQMGTGNFTVEFWWQPSNVSGYHTLFDKGYNTAGGMVLQTSAANLSVIVGGSTLITAGTFVAGSWHHIAVTRSGTTVTLYVNGVSVGTGTSSANLNSTHNVGIGASTNQTGNGAYPATGYISNLRVVKASAVYTAAFAPPRAPLTAITNTSLLCLQDSRFRDNSTNNFTITKAGDAAVARFSPFAPPRITAAATSTGSVYFDGSGDYLTAPSNAAFSLGTLDFCIEAWIMPASWISGYGVIARNPSGSGFFLGGNSGNLIFHLTGVGDLITTSQQPPLRTWSHVAVMRSGTTLSLYLNGTRIGTTTNSTNFTATDLAIGADPSSGQNYTGNISNFRMVKGNAVYNPALTTLTVPTAPLTAISGTSLLTAQSASTVTDASTNNFTITKVGNANANEVAPFGRVTYTYGGSGYFDGTGDYLTIPNTDATNFATGDFTIECWFNTPSGGRAAGGGGSIMGKYNGNTGGDWGFELGVSTARDISLYSGNTIVFQSPTNMFSAGVWNHLAVVRSGSVMTAYINGVSVYSATVTASLSSLGAASAYIGYAGGGSALFVGYISNLRVVKSAVYTANFTPPTTPVTAITNTSLLVNFDNAGIYDSIGLTTLLTSGNAAVSTAVKKYGTGSLALNTTTNTYATVATQASNFAFGNGQDFTIEGWFHPAGLNYDQILMDWRPLSTNGVYPTVIVTSTNVFQFGYDFAGSNIRVTGTTALTINTWYHFAICRSGTNVRLFVNGTQEGSTLTSNTASLLCGTNRPVLGANGFQYDNKMNGFLEDIRVTRAARYTAAFTPPTAPFA